MIKILRMSPFQVFLFGFVSLQVYAVPQNESNGFKTNRVFDIVGIIGGEDASKSQFPYQISLRNTRSRQHFCGGTILTNRFLLTAAHCSQGQNSRPQSVYAVVGALHLDSDGLRVDLDRITPHEQYSKNRNINDISLLRTAKEIAFSRNVQPIALPTNNIEGNVHVLLSGWGRTSYPTPRGQSQLPDVLQYTKMTTITIQECKQRFRGNPQFSRQIYDSTLCTISGRNIGACMGDSGGPLVDASQKAVVGVVSWGIPCAKGYPDVFTRVYSYIDWIKKHQRH